MPTAVFVLCVALQNLQCDNISYSTFVIGLVKVPLYVAKVPSYTW